MISKKAYQFLLIFIVILGGIALYVVLANGFIKNTFFEGELRCESLNSGWERIYKDGSRESVTLPSSLKSEDGFITLEAVLPEIEEDGMYISVYGLQQDVAVFIDDELRTIYVNSRAVGYDGLGSDGNLQARDGRPSANAYLFCMVGTADSGSVMRIEMYSNAFYDRNAGEIFLGDQLGIWIHYFARRMAVVIAALTMTFIAAITMIMLAIYSLKAKIRSPLVYLLTGVLVIGCWKFLDNPVDNPFRQFIFNDDGSAQNAAYVMENFMIIPILCYIDSIQDGRYHKIFSAAEWISVMSGLVAVVLDITEIVYYSQYEPVLVTVVILSICLIVFSLIMDIVRKRVSGYLLVVSSLGFLALTGIMEVVALYYTSFNMFSGSVVYGLLVVMIMAILNTCIELSTARAEVTAATRASEEGRRFLSGMSHEIRTPVNTILGMNEMIRRETANDLVLEYSMDLSNAGNTLVALIDDIIDFTRMENGRIEMNENPYQTASLFNDVCVLMERSAADKKLDFNLNISSDIPAGLCGDVSRIRQIMLNILTNAVKYTEKGSVTMEARGDYRDERFIFSFSVTDTGMGIKKEEMQYIFDAYSRADEGRNNSIEGTGLGLAITKRLVETMNGEILAESVYGEGSTFTVRIPQKVSDPRPMGEFVRTSMSRVRDRDALAAFRAQGKRILAVDDNMTNLVVFRGLLKHSRMRIDIATSGRDALKMLAENDYDLVFMDHMMPGLDGVETLRLLRAEENNRNSETPVVVLTANVISGAEQMYLGEGFAAYLAKPIAHAKLTAVLQNYLR
ncbi:MAG: response regulator [Lachnospiraceae bacterium]|nr:response regulator [Lachnospiraceae bacterium]